MSKMKLTPVRNLLIVKLDSKEEMSAGGIIIPEVAQKAKRIGTILEAGPDSIYKAGSKILVSEFAGDSIDYLGKGFAETKIIPSEDVQAIVEDSQPEK